MFTLSNTYCRVMGILNVTPDSFADGGRYNLVDDAVNHALAMFKAGASIIDIGGESSHPNAIPISTDEELSRVIPVIESLRQFSDCVLSIDTKKTIVMKEAVNAGASLINDVTALATAQALNTVASLDVPICLMHQQDLEQQDIIKEIVDFFVKKIAECEVHGIAKERLILDPGFGFNKSVEQNLTMINRLTEFGSLQLPLLVGVSRKGTISKVTACAKEDRLWGSLGLNCIAAYNGASLLRVHDVEQTVMTVTMVNALNESVANLR